MAGLSRLFSSSGACLNRYRNRVLCRAFSTSHPTQQPPIIHEVGFKESLLKEEVEGCENWELFKSWMLEHDKKYKSEEETLFRYKVFCKANKDVEMWNKEDTGCTYGLNFYSDSSPLDSPPVYPDCVRTVHWIKKMGPLCTYDPTQPPLMIIDQVKVGVKESLLKEVEGSENWGSFKSWRLEYNKNYPTEEQTLYRYKVFCEAKKEVEMLNKEEEEEGSGCTYALNFFADITPFDMPPAYRIGMIRFRMYHSTLNYNPHAPI